MSDYCGFNIKIDNFNIETKKKLEVICHKNNLGIFYDKKYLTYYEKEQNFIENYNNFYNVIFHLSDSFKYDTYTGLDISFIEKFDNDSYHLFEKKFLYLKKIVNIFLEAGAEKIEIFISDQGPLELEDFIIIESKSENLLPKIYKEIINQSNLWAYGFPILKIEIKNQSI